MKFRLIMSQIQQLKHLICLVVLVCASLSQGKSQELYKVKSLPCNTPDKNEFSAIPFEGNLLFCSDRIDFSAIKFETTKGGKSLINIFSVPNDSSLEVKPANSFNSLYAHDGPITFYDYGNRAVITRTQSDKAKLKSLYKDTKLGLFFYEKKNGKWKESSAFTFNDVSYSCGQATINEQGTVMVFSSDMPGGSGGTDLYYSTFNEEDSTWILPVNLGPIINSSKNEMFPFLHPSGILYYSSAGKKGKGGLDVFHTVGGYPYARIVHEVDEINSEKDDFGFWASADFSKGYLTSNRAGTDDIYSVKLSHPEFTNCTDYVEVNYCYEFFEEASIDVDTIPMIYEWDFGDGTTKKGLSAYHCYREPGNYTVQLNVFDTVVNALFMNEALYQLEIADYNQPLMDVPDSANPMMPFFVSTGQARFRDFEIGAYYWDFGDGIEMKGERFPVTLVKPGLYEVILGVTSVPDNNGRTQTKCFKKKLVVTDSIISPPLADDSSDPANEKLPGGTRGTTYVLVEDDEGFHVTRLKGDGTTVSNINQLPNTVYYVKLDENGDTIVKKHSQDINTRQLLENYLEQAEAPYEVKKNGLISYNAFLPSDTSKYPVYGADVKKFYGSLDSLVNSPWQFTLLPDNVAKALRDLRNEEAGLVFVNKPYDKKYLPKYNTVIESPDDSTTVFYKQTTTDVNKGTLTNTSQYDTQANNNIKNNGNTNNVQNSNQANNNQTANNATNQNSGNNSANNALKDTLHNNSNNTNAQHNSGNNTANNTAKDTTANKTNNTNGNVANNTVKDTAVNKTTNNLVTHTNNTVKDTSNKSNSNTANTNLSNTTNNTAKDTVNKTTNNLANNTTNVVKDTLNKSNTNTNTNNTNTNNTNTNNTNTNNTNTNNTNTNNT
ncbi:MAG TPA: PKD domain-containing protein, partial [Flavobacteriales bacterium]|nr:PKD domain-containing protein [Flavobacteriales bacterium]